jgi:hypothetical protein
MGEQVGESASFPLESRRKERPYFDVSLLPQPSHYYVCWVDIMGADSAMRRSTRIASNFVMKLHAAALEARTPTLSAIELYPAIDGVYVVSARQDHTLSYLKAIMTRLALTFVLEEEPLHRFLVRGGMTYGPVAKGNNLHGNNNALRGNPDYVSHVCIGMPLPQAFNEAGQASPFGIYFHESVRTFAPRGQNPLSFTHWPWWKWHEEADDTALAAHLRTKLYEHLEWCLSHSTTVLYPPEAICRHRKVCDEYFCDVSGGLVGTG